MYDAMYDLWKFLFTQFSPSSLSPLHRHSAQEQNMINHLPIARHSTAKGTYIQTHVCRTARSVTMLHETVVHCSPLDVRLSTIWAAESPVGLTVFAYVRPGRKLNGLNVYSGWMHPVACIMTKWPRTDKRIHKNTVHLKNVRYPGTHAKYYARVCIK
jgi:hypothetical protein